MTKMLKYKNVVHRFQQNEEAKHVILMYFFEQTKSEIGQLLAGLGQEFCEMTPDELTKSGYNLLDARSLSNKNLPHADMAYVLELHPIYSTNRIPLEAATKAGLKELTYFTGLDEGVMALFGSERMIHLMETLGLKEDEAVEHSMVTKSIEKAQQKLEAKITAPIDVKSSSEEWIEKNKIQK